MDLVFRSGASWPGAVGVSGGGDSVSLMLLLAEWAKTRHKPLPVVLVVDHGLRRDSAKEAGRVAEHARTLGLTAHRLHWDGPKPKSNIESLARAARYRLMGERCRRDGLNSIYLAHTLDDQAETFLLRLARGSGIDGLSGMKIVSPLPSPDFASILLVRPLLSFTRNRLRDFLRSRREVWMEDPMNDDPRFARVRMRAAGPMLSDLGLTPQRIADAASHLARAREVLDRTATELTDQICSIGAGAALVDAQQLVQAPDEIGLRVLAGILARVSGHTYRPRFERLERLFGLIRRGELGRGRTLHGCRIAPAKKAARLFGPGTISIFREERRAGAGNVSGRNFPHSGQT